VLLQHVKQQILAVMGVPPGHGIDNEQGLRDAGLDSLMALELKNRLQDDVGRSLPATLAFDFPTIAALTHFLADEVLRLGAPGILPADAESTISPAAADLTDLTDDEAERLLAEELSSMRRDRRAAPALSAGRQRV
jgi:acyl carrier protein